MLLEMDNSELLNLLESPDALLAKIDEALQVLNDNFGGQARNQPNAAAAPPANASAAPTPVAGAQQAAPPSTSGGLDLDAFTKLDAQAQKSFIGERLYPSVYEHQPELAGKITGMLLEMDNSELLNLLESPDALLAKIDEALQVLKAHQAS